MDALEISHFWRISSFYQRIEAGLHQFADTAAQHGLLTEETRKEMKNVLREIQDGTFAGNWITENKAAGRAHFLAMRRVHAEHPSEEVGKKLRNMMSWLKK